MAPNVTRTPQPTRNSAVRTTSECAALTPIRRPRTMNATDVKRNSGDAHNANPRPTRRRVAGAGEVWTLRAGAAMPPSKPRPTTNHPDRTSQDGRTQSVGPSPVICTPKPTGQIGRTSAPLHWDRRFSSQLQLAVHSESWRSLRFFESPCDHSHLASVIAAGLTRGPRRHLPDTLVMAPRATLPRLGLRVATYALVGQSSLARDSRKGVQTHRAV